MNIKLNPINFDAKKFVNMLNKESSETIEKQLEYLEIYPNSVWNWIKSEEIAEPSRVGSKQIRSALPLNHF